MKTGETNNRPLNQEKNPWDSLKTVEFAGNKQKISYNEKYIDGFGQESLWSALGNENTLKAFSDSYLSQYEPDSKAVAKRIAGKESLDHFVAKGLSSEHPEMFAQSQEFKNYADYIVKIADEKQFKSNSGEKVLYPEYFTNPVLKNKKMRELVLKTAYRDKNPDMGKINAWLDARETEYNRTIKDFVERGIGEKKKLSQKQLDILGDYIYAGKNFNDGVAKKYAEFCFNDIKDEHGLKPSTPMIGALTNYFASTYSIDENVRKNSRFIIANPRIVKDKEGNDVKEFNIGVSKNGGFCVLEQGHFSKMSLISDNSLNKSRTNLEENNDIYRLMMISFHELTHDHQKNMVEQGDKSSSSMVYIMKGILNKDGEKCYEKTTTDGGTKKVSYYKANHDSDEMEIQADEEAWRQCRKFLVDHQKYQVWGDEEQTKKYNERWAKCKHNEEEVRARRTFVKKLAVSGEEINAIEFDMDNMKKAISDEPNLLDKYPQLKDYFESSGELRVDVFVNERIAETEWADNASDRRDDVFGTEIGTYLFEGKGASRLEKYLNDNGDRLNEPQVKNLLNNMHNIIHQNVEKRRILLKGVKVENYDETKTRGKDFDIEEIKKETQIRYLGQYCKMVKMAEIVRKSHPEMSERITLEESLNGGYFSYDFLKDGKILDKSFVGETVKKYEAEKHPFLAWVANTLREQYLSGQT